MCFGPFESSCRPQPRLSHPPEQPPPRAGTATRQLRRVGAPSPADGTVWSRVSGCLCVYTYINIHIYMHIYAYICIWMCINKQPLTPLRSIFGSPVSHVWFYSPRVLLVVPSLFLAGSFALWSFWATEQVTCMSFLVCGLLGG